MQETYPRWRYHRSHPPAIAHTPEDCTEAGGWADTPAAFHKPEPALAAIFEDDQSEDSGKEIPAVAPSRKKKQPNA